MKGRVSCDDVKILKLDLDYFLMLPKVRVLFGKQTSPEIEKCLFALLVGLSSCNNPGNSVHNHPTADKSLYLSTNP